MTKKIAIRPNPVASIVETDNSNNQEQERDPIPVAANIASPQNPPEQGTRTPTSWGAIFSYISLLAPVGYLVGYYYEEGYLHAYGLDQGLFARSAQEYIAISFGAIAGLLDVVAPALQPSVYKKWLIGCALIGGYVLLIFMYKKLTEWAVSRFKPISMISNHIKKKSTMMLVLFGAVMLLIPVIFVYALVFLLLPAIMADSLGNHVASKEIEAFKGCGKDSAAQSMTSKLVPETCVTVSNAGRPMAHGKIIAATDKFVAIFNGEKSILMPIKPETTIEQTFLRK